MSTPVFNQITGTLLYELSTLSESGVNGYWVGYYNSGNDLLASASTSEVWQNISGFYLFLKKTPDNFETFQTELQQLIPSINPVNQMRGLWLDNTDNSPFVWSLVHMDAKSSNSGETIVWKVQRSFSFLMGNYQLSVPGNSVLSYVDDSNGGGFSFSGNGTFSGPEGSYVFSPGKVSFTGASLGVITGSFSAPVIPETSLWEVLKVGLQFSGAPAPFDENSEETYSSVIDILYMPVLFGQNQALTPTVSFDPLNLLNADRTHFGLFAEDGTAPGTFDSYFRTTLGYSIQLQPLAAVGSFPSARLVFGQSPMDETTPGVYTYHLSFEGAYSINVILPENALNLQQTEQSNQLLLGLSGLEYVTLGGTENDQLFFLGGQPAFIPSTTSDENVDKNISGALTYDATTSHLTVLPSTGNTGRIYFAQPKQAPVFSGKFQRSDGILDFNPMPAFELSSGTSVIPPVFPCGVYAGLSGDYAPLSELLENVSIAPYRHYQLGLAYGVESHVLNLEVPMRPQRRLRAETDPLGVTPQGLIAELTPDYEDFDGLYIGNMPGTNYPKVALTAVEGKFKQSLQSNQLFFVAANVDVLMQGTSVQYELTEQDKDILLVRGVPQTTIDAVYAAISDDVQPFDTEDAFVTAIEPTAGAYLNDFLFVGGILKVEMDGWTFQLSPRSWRTDVDSPTLMIAKFCNRSLEDLVADTSSWVWPEVAIPNGGSITYTQGIIQGMIDSSKSTEATSDYVLFYKTVVSDPNWNGFLFLNAPVDISEFPDELKFLVAGVDMTKFYAHHIGFSQTPFTVSGGVPQLDQTAAFGLIDYNDEADLYKDETIQFAFKTMRLKARFANAALADFSAQVELMINYILATPLAKQQAARGNNLIINGTYQRVGTLPSYAFALTGQNVFNGSRSVLISFEVLSVQLVTGGSPTDEDQVLTSFILTGNMSYINNVSFDLFSYGPDEEQSSDSFLRFNGLEIKMVFNITTPNTQTFLVRENGMNFDLSNSKPRKNGLLNNFPLTINGLIASPNLTPDSETPSGQTPEDMGYTSIYANFDQTPMIPSWYGLQYVLDMGTLGALTGGQSVKITILAAWSEGANQDDLPAYVGIKLPNIPAIGGSFPLQGILKLGFKSFAFQTYTNTNGSEALLGYNLRMKRFAFSILVWSFPPGNFDVVLFGEPGNPNGSLGWYAAYDDDPNQSKSNEQMRLAAPEKKLERIERKQRSGRRTPPVN